MDLRLEKEIQRLKTFAKTAKSEGLFTLNEDENRICDNIKEKIEQLHDGRNDVISDCETFMRQHGKALPDNTKIKQLVQKYGGGAVVITFANIQNYIQKKGLIFRMVSQDCVLSDCTYFAPNYLLDALNVTRVRWTSKHSIGYQFVAIIYDNYPSSEVFVSWDRFWIYDDINIRVLKLTELHQFVIKVEGRNCSFCKKMEKREKYKKCAGCKAVFYCTRSCQKRDWCARHRNKCNTVII
eukprot:1136963_1